MSYATRSLAANEHVLYDGGISFLWLMWRTLVSAFWTLVWLVVFAPVALLVLLVWIGHVIRWWTTEYAITNRRVLYKEGLIRRNTRELFHNRIESADVEQTVIARLFGFGNVLFRGQGNATLAFVYVQAPLLVKKTMLKSVDN
jgi:uncharacterized membrane protein YdbT with pleckstrin-like domain